MMFETEVDTNRSIALYCRVSTDEQAREGVSLEEQQERLKAYCRAMGWTMETILYVDDGYSAKNMDRPQLKKLIQAVQDRLISKVMITKLDRMSRKLLDLLQLIDLFQEHHVSFISIGESFDTNTPSGRLTLQVLGAVAEFERERIRERVFDNMLHAAHSGKWLTQSPYGYRLEDKQLIIYEPEAKIVRHVFDVYLNKGLGYFAIAKALNEDGIPSRFNKEWSLRSVKLMLTNPVYKGTLVWNRVDSSKKTRVEKEEANWVTVDDCLPVIIDKDTSCIPGTTVTRLVAKCQFSRRVPFDA
jgi:site-specific DNA recombinase